MDDTRRVHGRTEIHVCVFLDFNFRFDTASSENMVPKQKNEMEKAGEYYRLRHTADIIIISLYIDILIIGKMLSQVYEINLFIYLVV